MNAWLCVCVMTRLLEGTRVSSHKRCALAPLFKRSHARYLFSVAADSPVLACPWLKSTLPLAHEQAAHCAWNDESDACQSSGLVTGLLMAAKRGQPTRAVPPLQFCVVFFSASFVGWSMLTAGMSETAADRFCTTTSQKWCPHI